jgi:HlyD family secretion protein
MPRSVAQPGPGQQEDDQPVAVEVQTVEPGSLVAALDYTGTTRPAQTATLRAQVEGQVVELQGDVGDVVGAGQPLVRIDPNLLAVGVTASESELSARQSEVAQAQTQVSDARAAVEQARLQVEQARTDADRLRTLAAEGAVSDQAAEQAQLVLDTAVQALNSAQDQVQTRLQAVQAAQGRVAAQRAAVAQSQERLSFTTVRSPLPGVILSRTVEPGDLAQPGTELLQVGDLSTIEITVELSELDLNRISRGQPVAVQLDAFPGQSFNGRVTRIAPVADATARLIPVEVTIANPGGRIGSGLLARVQFLSPSADRLVLPESALQGDEPQVFVLAGTEAEPTVVAQSVQVGDRRQGQVEILAGLTAGDRVVVRSDRPLTEGQAVRLSILSDAP